MLWTAQALAVVKLPQQMTLVKVPNVHVGSLDQHLHLGYGSVCLPVCSHCVPCRTLNKMPLSVVNTATANCIQTLLAVLSCAGFTISSH